MSERIVNDPLLHGWVFEDNKWVWAGASGASGAPSWDDITDKPADYPPSVHGHEIADVNGLQGALDDAGNNSEDGEWEGQFATWDATDSMWKPQTGIFANRNMGNNGDSRDFYVAEGMSTFEVHLASGLQSIQLGTPTAQFEGPKTWFGFHKPQLYAYIDVNDGSGKVTALKLKTDSATFSGTVSDSAGPLMSSRNLIETLSTLRTATQDETTLEGLRDAIGNAIGGLIEKFEAMQESVKQEASSE